MDRTLQQWLDHIQAAHPVGWDLGLDRVGAVGRQLDVLKPAKKVVLVAGTNGKGSTVACLAALAGDAGLSFGVTTSPFLQRYNEQIVINGQCATDEDIIRAFEAIEDGIVAASQNAEDRISLSYFEYGALAAMWLFREANLDLAVLEIGLGGRLDAMNIVDPDVSVITRIDIDHVDWLGADRETIAVEKAGIMRAGIPVVISDPEPPRSLGEQASKLAAPVYQLGEAIKLEGQTLGLANQVFQIPSLALPTPSAVAALSAFQLLGYKVDQARIDVLTGVSLPGRYQVLNGAPKVILDVAHNPNAARFLAARLAREGVEAFQVVCAMYGDKDCEGVFQALDAQVGGWHFANLDQSRAASASELAARLKNSCGSASTSYDKVADALEGAKKAAGDSQTVLVCGSFPVVAEVLSYLGVVAVPDS